jgi:hypothetical protein
MLYSNNSRITYILLIILIIISTIPSQVYGANWIYICSSSNGIMFYYDSDSMRINKKEHIIKVWIKNKLPKTYKDKNRNAMAQLHLSEEQWNKFDYSIILTMYNYNDETSSMVSVNEYSYSGEVLDSFDSPIEWRHIIPGSIDETILDNLMEASGIKK